MENQPWVSHWDSGLLRQVTEQPNCPAVLFWVCYFWSVPTTTSFNEWLQICLGKSVHKTWNTFAGWCVRKSFGSLNLMSASVSSGRSLLVQLTFMRLFRALTAADCSSEPVPKLWCVPSVRRASYCHVYNTVFRWRTSTSTEPCACISIRNTALSWKITSQIFRFPCLKLVCSESTFRLSSLKLAVFSPFDYFLGKILLLTKREMLCPFIKWLKIAED